MNDSFTRWAGISCAVLRGCTFLVRLRAEDRHLFRTVRESIIARLKKIRDRVQRFH